MERNETTATETTDETTIPTAEEAAASVEANNKRRQAMREKHNRLASLALATRLDARNLASLRAKACGSAEGAERKGLAKAWSAERREALYTATDGKTTTVMLQRDAGKRWLATGLVVVSAQGAEETLRVSGIVSVADATGAYGEGAEITVRLSRHNSRPDKRGKIHTTFAVTTVGTMSNGVRVALRGRLTASRHVRVVASAL